MPIIFLNEKQPRKKKIKEATKKKKNDVQQEW
jgi:endonuclease V-like protein UPF0215 family